MVVTKEEMKQIIQWADDGDCVSRCWLLRLYKKSSQIQRPWMEKTSNNWHDARQFVTDKINL